MDKKVRDLIYLDTDRYISIESLRIFYWGITLIPFMLMVLGIEGIRDFGITFKTLFPFVSYAIWSLLYWTFLLIIQSKKTKKSFELRFLVNGMAGFFITLLFGILFFSFALLDEYSVIDLSFLVWVFTIYIISSAFFIGLVVLGVHKGVYQKIKEKAQTPKALLISYFFAAMIPVAGTTGMYISRILRKYTSDAVQNITFEVLVSLIIFLPIIGHINFVQYYYCKKYNITCDENGDSTSPRLDYAILQEQKKKKKKKKRAKRKAKLSKIPRWVKIIVCIICAPILLYIAIMIVGIIIIIAKELLQMLR